MARQNKVIELAEIMHPARKRGGITYPAKPSGYSARIHNPSTIEAVIEVYDIRSGTGRSFNVGDTCEYDSYNLIYTGEIVSITQKSVIVRPSYQNKTKRMSLVEFAWRNYNFSLAEAERQNIDTMQYI